MRTHVDATEQVGVIIPAATKCATELLHIALAARAQWPAGLGERENQVRRYILSRYPTLGHAPGCREIEETLGLGPDQVQAILRKLHKLDLLYLDGDGREVLSAYPFSSLPTRHLVRFHDWPEAKPVYALCAVDALGISFICRRDVVITSPCAFCGSPIALVVHDRAIATHYPAETVVWVGTARSECAATSVCPAINFFCSPGHVEAWRQKQPEAAGHIVSLSEALYLARELFEFEGVLQEMPHATAATANPPSAISGSVQPQKAGAAFTSVGGLMAAFFASVCCVGPLLFGALGVGVGATGFLASAAGFLKALLPYRPWFVGLTVVLLGISFYLASRTRRAVCAPGTSGGLCMVAGMNWTLLWVMTAVAMVLVLAPYWLVIFTG